jgi:hypothetical protein
VIRASVTFDSEQKPAGLFGIAHTEVDAVPSGAHLWRDVVRPRLERVVDRLLERRLQFAV